MTPHPPAAWREAVVDRQLLPRCDLPLAAIVDPSPDDLSDEVGIAGMVDIFGPAATPGAVERPVVIKFVR